MDDPCSQLSSLLTHTLSPSVKKLKGGMDDPYSQLSSLLTLSLLKN